MNILLSFKLYVNTSVKFKTWMLNVEGVVHARGKASKEARWSDKEKVTLTEQKYFVSWFPSFVLSFLKDR